MTARSLGGDFELAPAVLATAASADSLPLTGRAALHRVLSRLHATHPGAPLYLPEYLCASMLVAARASAPDVRFYAIDASLRPAEPERIAAGAIVVLVRYFGLVDLAAEVTRLRATVPGVVLVADEAHAPWALAESGADVAITSWRKAYPVVGGAPIHPPETDPRGPVEPSIQARASAFAALRLAAAATKALARSGARVDDEVYLSLFHRAEAMLDEPWALDARLAADDVPALSRLPLDELHAQRRANFHHLAEQLARHRIQPILPLLPGATPLFLPVLVADRDHVRRSLARAGIFCPAHWPVPADLDLAAVSPLARALYSDELSLLVDPRQSAADMDRLADALGRDSIVPAGARE